MDCSNVFDSVSYHLLAQLNVYGISIDALQLIRRYLSLKHERVQVNNIFSDWKEIKFGVPQELVLGLLFFNEFVNNIFLSVRYTNICIYTDDITIFACYPTLETIIRQLKKYFTFVAKWLFDNYLKLNGEKCNLMIFGDKCSKATARIRTSTINESKYEKLRGITFDKKLGFRKHVEALCREAKQNLYTLARLPTYIDSIIDIFNEISHQVTV